MLGFHSRSDRLSGKPLKWLAITDEYTRECLALEVDRSITADKVVDVLTNLFLTRGVPKHIRSDNGPEFIAQAISKHAERTGLEMLYIEPGSPWENGFAESFFSRLRDELLNCEEFANLAEARWFARRRQEEHNEERPHSSLNYQTPSAFAALCAASAPDWLRLRLSQLLHSSSTEKLPNPYSHNPWYRKRGRPTPIP